MSDDPMENFGELHQSTSLGRTLPSRLAFVDQKESVPPNQVIQTAEFARLAYLRRTGLAWLVFPSATQTWLEYSIGNWQLARIAESLITVTVPDSRRQRRLSSWLRATNLRREFYFAMLCSEIGRAPLRHVLENSEPLLAALRSLGIREMDHTGRAALLIGGRGELFETWRATATSRYGEDVKTVSRLTIDSTKSDGSVCWQAVRYLISGCSKHLVTCGHQHEGYLHSIATLSKGLLALRRFDHYGRDSYFTSSRRYSRDLRQFLSSISVTMVESGEAAVSVDEQNSRCASYLLLRRKLNLLTAIRSPEVIALNQMAGWALGNYVRSRPDGCEKMLFLEDDQLLELITSLNSPGAHSIGRRIRARDPYAYVGRWHIASEQDDVPVLAEIRSSATQSDMPPIALSHYQNEVSENLSSTCFDPRNIHIGRTDTSLADYPDSKNNFEDLQNASRRRYVYVFVRDHAFKQELRLQLNKELSG